MVLGFFWLQVSSVVLIIEKNSSLFGLCGWDACV